MWHQTCRYRYFHGHICHSIEVFSRPEHLMPEVRKGSGGRSGAPAPLLAWAGRPATFLSLSAASGRKVVQYTNGGVEQVGGEELACLWLNPARKRLILSHVNKRRKKNCATPLHFEEKHILAHEPN